MCYLNILTDKSVTVMEICFDRDSRHPYNKQIYAVIVENEQRNVQRRGLSFFGN